MANAENVAELVGQIYDAAAGGSWKGVMQSITRAVGAHGNLVYSMDEGRRPGRASIPTVMTGGMEYEGFSAELLAQYASYYVHCNIWAANERMSEGRAVTSSELYPDADLKKTEYYAHWLKRQDIFYALGGLVCNQDGILTKLTFIRSEREQAYGATEQRLMQQLMPHWRSATLLRNRLQRAEQLSGAALGVLESVPYGVILLAADGRVLHCTQRAEQLMAATHCLAIRSDKKIEAREPARTLQIGVAAARACAAYLAAAPAWTESIPLHAADGTVIQASLAPLPHSARPGTQPCAVLFLDKAEERPAMDRATLQDVYKLTRTEAEVVALLVQGMEPKKIAAVRRTAIDTVRSQMSSAMTKMGVRRQAELVRKVMLAGRGE